MPSLVDCLNTCSRRSLRAIARTRRVSLRSSLLKSDIVAVLAVELADPVRYRRAIERLPGTDRDALETLRRAGGRLPAAWLRAATAEPAAIATPGPPDTLIHLGLVFEIDHDIVVPDDLLPHIPRRRSRPTASSDDTETAVAIHDIAVLLAMVHVHEVRAGRGTTTIKLSPTLLNMWRQRSARPSRRGTPAGEPPAPRERFLQYLAACAAVSSDRQTPLISIAAGQWCVTPAGFHWLQVDAGTQLKAIAHGLAKPDPDRWRAYRMPAHDLPVAPGQLIATPLRHDNIPSLDGPEVAGVAQSLLADLTLADPSGPLPAALRQAVADIVTGPLRWLGLVQADAAGGYVRAPWAARWPELTTSAVPSHGTAWEIDITGADPMTSALHVRSSRGHIPRPAHRFWLEVMSGAFPPILAMPIANAASDPPAAAATSPAPTATDPRRHHHCVIDARSFTAALQRGHSFTDLAHHLGAAIGRPLDPTTRAILEAWHAAAERAVIHTLPVLETTDDAIIARLAARRRDRALVGRTLGRRAVIVDPSRLPALARALAAITGVPPQIETALAAPGKPGDLGTGGASALWVAARVYQALGRHVRLPHAVPQRALDALSARMTPAEQALATAMAESVTDAVAQALAGYLAYPAWAEPTANPLAPPMAHRSPTAEPIDVPADRDDALADVATAGERDPADDPTRTTRSHLAAIEAALAAGTDLDITYYTAGRGETTRRQVEPYRVEWRGKVPYLVAYCTRAAAERVFRVDRIREMTPCDPAEDESMPPF